MEVVTHTLMRELGVASRAELQAMLKPEGGKSGKSGKSLKAALAAQQQQQQEETIS